MLDFTTYSVYDGPDALIASKLVEMGYPVSMANVDWYKRQLLAEAERWSVMSMRRQLYEWQINRQVNGFPFTDPAQV